MDKNKYIDRVFNTSPGNFTLRETKLIKYYLAFNGNVNKNYSERKLWKAFNKSDNNIKWILKTFLMANLQNKTKHRKGLKDVVTTANGNIFKRRKLDLVLLGNKATIEVKYTQHRFVMFPDRVGSGKLHHYQVQKMAGIKIPQVKKEQIVNNTKIPQAKEQTTNSIKIQNQNQNRIATAVSLSLQREIEMFCSALLVATGAIPFLFKLHDNLDYLIDLLNSNKGELDFLESGHWFKRWCVTEKDAGNKLTVTYAKRTSIYDDWTEAVYKYFDINRSSKTKDNWLWVKNMYEIVAPVLKNQITVLPVELSGQYKKENINALHDQCLIFQTTINKHCNDSYLADSPNKAFNRETDLYNLGTEIMKSINVLIESEFSNHELNVPAAEFDRKELFGEYEDKDRFSDEELMKIFKSIENDE